MFRILCMIAWLTFVDGYGNGAPEGACKEMTPYHHHKEDDNVFKPQTSSSAFEVTIDRDIVRPGETVTVNLLSPSDRKFKGFFVQGRSGDEIVGTFEENDLSRTRNCLEKSNSAATQKSNSPKSSLALTWTAPTDFRGNVIFNTTFVENYTTFWVDVKSKELKVEGIPVLHERRSTTSPPVEEEETIPFTWLYTGCYESKGCFGGPSGCVDKRSCSHVVTYALNGSQFHIEMMTKTPGWAGVGFSDDLKMGRDAVTVCAINGSNSRISIFQTWNTKKYGNEVLGDMTKGLSNLFSKHEDGFTYCSFTLDSQLVINVQNDEMEFNFLNRSYYLFLARGRMASVSPPVHLDKHNIQPFQTSAAVLLSDVSPIGMASNTLIKLHGCLMSIAWVGTVSLAIFLARFYKQTWTDVVHCKQKVWFTWHRLLNSLTVLLTIAGLVVIFLQIQDWSQVWKTNYHPILGIIAASLAILQPIMAAFRCHPGTPKRPVFNVLHFCVGNAAYVLAIVTLFLAKGLAKANLPEFYQWIMIAFVVFHALVFLIMEAFTCFKGKALRSNQIAMKDLTANGNAYHVNDPNTEAPGTRFRQFMLSIYTFGIVCFVTALVATVAVSPVKDL